MCIKILQLRNLNHLILFSHKKGFIAMSKSISEDSVLQVSVNRLELTSKLLLNNLNDFAISTFSKPRRMRFGETLYYINFPQKHPQCGAFEGKFKKEKKNFFFFN